MEWNIYGGSKEQNPVTAANKSETSAFGGVVARTTGEAVMKYVR